MAQEVVSFTVPKNEVDQVSTTDTQLTFKILYHADEPAGYEIIATGSSGSFIICPRPCPKVALPSEI